MLRVFVAGLAIALAASGCTPGRALLQGPDFTQVVGRETAAVVNISGAYAVRPALADLPLAEDEEAAVYREFLRRFFGPDAWAEGRSLGSGFVISPDGYILTNAHLVEDAGVDEVVARLADGREFRARVVGADALSDIALLKIEASGLHSARIGDARKLRAGQWVAAMGSPFGFELSVTAGIVSGIGRSIPEESNIPFIQTDVAVNPGNSGGPLFNLRGEVVAVNSGIYSATGGYMGLSFAVPINVAMDVARELRASGKVTRGRIGVSLQKLTAELAAALKLPRVAGALVVDVHGGGPAERAGLASADVVTAFDGHPVQDDTALAGFSTHARPGAIVELEVMRAGRPLRMQVEIAEAHAVALARGAELAPDADPLGLQVAPLDVRRRERLGLSGGVLVKRSSAAAQRSGLLPGDVILSVNGSYSPTVDVFAMLMGQAAGGSAVVLLVQRDSTRAFVALRLP